MASPILIYSAKLSLGTKNRISTSLLIWENEMTARPATKANGAHVRKQRDMARKKKYVGNKKPELAKHSLKT